MDAITLLKNDHKAVEKLFKQFEKTGDRAHATRRKLVEQITEELSKHAAIEEQLFYPVTRGVVPEVEDDALESLEEHHIVKWVLHELEGMDPADERYEAKVTVLIEQVRHHVEEEESDYFPKVREAMGRNDLNELGDAMAKVKEVAPTHPHPRSPDTPPGNIVTGTAAGALDRVADTVSGLAQGGVSAAQDLIARITGRRESSAAPTGSPTARKAADKVRKGAKDALDKAERTGRTTIRSGTKGAKTTARTARSAAKATGRTATAGAKRTATTAKGAARTTKSSAKRAAAR
jgi:hemerythrin superfamily protein